MGHRLCGQKEIPVNISGTAVATYAAVVSTITVGIQLANFIRGRMKVRVRVRHDMQIAGYSKRNANDTLTTMTVTNMGRRPVTITSVEAKRLFPCKTHYVFSLVNPSLPRELMKGQYVQAIVKKDGLDLKNISTWEAHTSAGKTFRLSQAPWHKRWVSDWRWKRHFKR